ncbi:MAG: hypothetical protein ACR652_11520 [Methylocystis sp.]
MIDKPAATLLFLFPFATLWLAFTAAETARAVAAIKGARHDVR